MKTNDQSVLAREIKIAPAWAWGLAAIAFVAAQLYFNIAVGRHPHAPPPWERSLLGLLAGAGACAYLLLLGYVYRDAKRRGMSPVLWTLVALMIPNGVGILLYFVLRKPLHHACPQCGNALQVDFRFCPRCNCKLGPSCPRCQRVVAATDIYCAYCGTPLLNGPPAAPSSQPVLG